MVSPLGAGSEASVWLAQEVQTGKQVALKYFTPQPGVTLFRELNYAMQRAHPNIVALLDFTYLPEGDSFLVFEYVAGGSLRDWMNEEQVCAPEKALLIMRDIFAALVQIHEGGSIHCDIKPENILRDKDSQTEDVVHKLTDFGVARKRNLRGPSSELVGSPAYMAPERFRQSIYPHSDLYSAGIIFYELLTGDRPFNGTAEEVARAHLIKPVPEIADLDGEIGGFLHNLLEKDPSHRIQTAELALRNIEALLNRDHSIPNTSTPKLPAAPAALTQLSLTGGIQARVRARYKVPVTEAAPRLLESNHRQLLALDFGSHLEFYDGLSGQPRNQILSKTGEALQFLGPDGIVHSAQQKIRYWSPQLATPIELATFCPRVSAVALSPDRKLLAWADDRKCEIIELESDNRISLQGLSLHSPPDLTWISPERLVVSSGPLKPKLRVFAADGHAVAEIDLSGPVLQSSENTPVPTWVTLNLAQPENLTVISVDSDQSWHQWNIPHRYAAFDFGGSGMLTLDQEGALTHWGPREQGHVITQIASRAHGFALSSQHRFGATWRDSDNHREITLYELRPKA